MIVHVHAMQNNDEKKPLTKTNQYNYVLYIPK